MQALQNVKLHGGRGNPPGIPNITPEGGKSCTPLHTGLRRSWCIFEVIDERADGWVVCAEDEFAEFRQGWAKMQQPTWETAEAPGPSNSAATPSRAIPAVLPHQAPASIQTPHSVTQVPSPLPYADERLLSISCLCIGLCIA